MKNIESFITERDRLNEIVMKYAGQGIKRFYSLDSQMYREGSLSNKTKELMGLVASLVLRCDDCINYHLIQCSEVRATDDEVEETMAIALIAGGSIVIPHLRRAFETWENLQSK